MKVVLLANQNWGIVAIETLRKCDIEILKVFTHSISMDPNDSVWYDSVKKKCEEYKKDWRLTILPEDIDTKKAYETLRQDYLDESLDPAQKWIKNITISPEKFHDASKIITDKLAKLLQNNMKEWESFYPLYPWRAALAFVSSFRDISHFRFEICILKPKNRRFFLKSWLDL